MTLEEAKRFFSNDLYATRLTGIVIESVAEHSARCSLVLRPEHRNAAGGVMGGVAFTLADFVFAVSTNTPESRTVTVSSTIQYLSAPKGQRLIGVSTCLKDGQHHCFYRIDITDDTGRAVATVSVCGAHLS